MVEVISNKPVGDRGLRRRGFECRMGIDHSCCGIESRIGDAHHSDVAIVVGDVLYEPLDRVVGVGAFINLCRLVVGRDVGSHVNKFSFRSIASPNILEDEDIAFPPIRSHGAAWVWEIVHAVWVTAIGCSLEKQGMGLVKLLGGEDGRVEFDPVSHWDHMFVFGVVGE